MDRLNQLKGETGGSRDLTLDTSSPPSESFMTANETSSKYFSLSEVDSTFDVSPSKDSAISTTADSEQTLTDTEIITNLSPIPKKVDDFQIGKQIEAANILSGGVNIFDDNDNSYDGNELVIDDNGPIEDSVKSEEILPFEKCEESVENTGNVTEASPSTEPEVVLQIDGKNVDAIAIGNGLYLYRKGVEELAAIQMIDDNQQQPSFKFLKVRENAEKNLEVYEEIEVEVPNKVPAKEGKAAEKKTNVPVKDISSIVSNTTSEKLVDNTTPKNDQSACSLTSKLNVDLLQPDSKADVNLNGKKVKFSESRKSPLISTFTPMTYHSTPNKEGIPLTKIMVDQQLHPNRHSDNVKKTIEVHTDSCKKEIPIKDKDIEVNKPSELSITGVEKIDSQEINAELLSSSQIIEQKINSQKIENDKYSVDSDKKEIHKDGNIPEKNEIEINNISDKTVKSRVDLTIDNLEDKVNKKIDVNNKETKDSCNESKINTHETNSQTKNIDTDLTLMEEEKNEFTNEPIIPVTEKVFTIENESTSKSVFTGRILVKTNEDINIKNNSSIGQMDDCANENKSIPNYSSKIQTYTCTNENIDIENDNLQTNITEEVTEKNVQLCTSTVVEKIDTVKEHLQTDDYINMTSTVAITGERNKFVDKNESDSNIDKLSDSEIRMSKKSENIISSVSNTCQVEKDSSNLCTTSVGQMDSVKPSDICKLQGAEPLEKIINKGPINCEKENDAVNNVVVEVANKKKENEIIVTSDVIENVTSSTANEASSDITKVRVTQDIQDVNKSSHILPKEVDTILTKDVCNQKYITEADKLMGRGPISKDVGHIPSNKNEKTTTSNNKKYSDTKSRIEMPSAVSKPEMSKVKIAESKTSNNSSAVPFGKWTEANRQEFLNKIKETKIPCSNSNTKQIKQPNDLNRRDILKKIDTQRQAHQAIAKTQDTGIANKSNNKAESTTVFVNKSIPVQKSNAEVKQNIPTSENLMYKGKNLETTTKQLDEESIICKDKNEISNAKKVPANRKITNKDLIDKTIEGIINRAVSTKPHEEWKQTIKMDAAETLKSHNSIVSLDDMERKMNELHGIPFVERPAHELPQINADIKTDKSNSISSNIPHLLPFKNKFQKKEVKDCVTDNISDEEIIEHEPITGDMTTPDTNICAQLSSEKGSSVKSKINDDENKKEPIITEKDFDKFARRNSITYENCLTVNFDGRESHNVIQTLIEKEVPCKKLTMIEKEVPCKKLTRNEIMLAESKAKSTNKQLLMRQNVNSIKLSSIKSEEDSFNKNYQCQSKVQLAYQSALTAKRQLECPVTIIEDKPVKVVFLDSVNDFTTSNLNVQGQELSPPKKTTLDSDSQSASESLDSEVLDAPYEMKLQDEIKSKSKHQRKQVLTPVDTPELELIEPSDLGINESPKKKRKIDETKDKSSKAIAPKKSYLLNRAIADEKSIHENPEIRLKESGTETKPFVTHTDTISAIDNLVKAAELIETQSENKGNTMSLHISESSLNTPAKRGRGRPRKYPLSETSPHINKTPNIQKKPRLIESNVTKKVIETDDSDSNEEFIKENWTMGKINENIVCPICNKLFRSENVVFKHVKHCTGPSPNRSDSDRRSLRQFSLSEEKSCDSDSDTSEESEDDRVLNTRVKETKPVFLKKEEVIVIEDTPIKEKTHEAKIRETNKTITKPKLLPKTDNLVCEFCGKTFRQLSYLINHKQQHKRDDEKKVEKNDISETKSIFSCEVCKKEFRKLHHLVQHRIIHNSNPVPSRLSRKNSNEKNELNLTKDENKTRSNDDPSAGFRCEPCDKSFRKLHHLVEHRETHDGINKKGSSNIAQASGEALKSSSQYTCRVCKKTFKKLQHLTDHKEQHLDSCSEKSDDKSVKSSLSTKDIIHECSLCYMVFPNEHSLNKHTVICLRKKKQAAAKQAKLLEQKEKNGEDAIEEEDKLSEDEIQNLSDKEYESETINNDGDENKLLANITSEISVHKIDTSNKDKLSETKIESDAIKVEDAHITSVNDDTSHLKRNIKEEEKVEKLDEPGKKHGKIRKIEVITIPDTPTPKKKIANIREKRLHTLPKRQKSMTVLPTVKNEKTPSDLSDDDEVRYMLNPNFKEEDTMEGKVFMKVRANKRSSLQFERPNSKDFIKRRITLQNTPKLQRSKSRLTETKLIKNKPNENLDVPVTTEHTDSDDSDIKYSFPETISQSEENEKTKTVTRQSIVAKRKSVTGIARRKSQIKHKIPIPAQKVKRRTTEVEHRCDCGQLFSSAALLARHTTLAHTPPRVRRRRDPLPDKPPQTSITTVEKRKSGADNAKLIVQDKNKSATSSNKPTVKSTRKSSAGGSESKTSSSKTVKSESNVKTLRSAAHKGVPVPDKMRKFMERSK